MSEYHNNLHRTSEPERVGGGPLSAQQQTQHRRSSEGDCNPMHNERLHQSVGSGLDSRYTNQSAQGGGKDDSAINYGRNDRVVAKPSTYPSKSSSFHIESKAVMPVRSPSLQYNNTRVDVAIADDIAKRLLTLNALGRSKLQREAQNQQKADLVPSRETAKPIVIEANYCSSPKSNGKGNNNKTMGFGVPPPPPPPPPPPRPSTASSSAGRAQQSLRENNNAHVGASQQPSAEPKKNSSPPSMRTDKSNTDGQTNAVNDDRLSNNRCNNKPPNLLHASFSSACSGSGGESSGKEKESSNIKPLIPVGGDPVVKGILHNNNVKNNNNNNNGRMYTNVNNQKVMDMASSQPNIEEDEITTSQFNKFASMSLNDLDKPLNKNMKGNNKTDNNSNKHEEFTHSLMSTGFTPRPIRITQFDDNLESPNNNNDNKSPGTPRYKGMTTTTTTESFVNSIREGIKPLPFEKSNNTSNNDNIVHPMSSTPRGESTPLTSIYKPRQNSRIPSRQC